MKSGAALILDLGTSSLKGALFDGGGRRLAFVRLPYEGEIRPDFENRSLSTQIKTAARAVTALRSCCPSAAIRSVVTVGNGPSWIAFDGSGAVCGAPLMWMAAARTETQPTSSRYLQLLDAFRRLRPEVFRQAQAFLPLSDALAWFLTGERAAALSCEAARFLYWEEDECRRLGLPFEKLPPFVFSGERLGVVTREAAAATGIDAGAVVYAGAPDYVAGLIGSGSLRAGAVFNRTGTSEAVNFVLTADEGGGAPFWDGFNVDSVFLPPTGIWFEEWFSRFAPPGMVPAQAADALAQKCRRDFSEEAFAAGQRLFNEIESVFCTAVRTLRERRRFDEAVIGGSQAESAAWAAQKGSCCGLKLRIPRYAACELTGGAVLAAAAGKRSAVVFLSDDYSKIDR